jgi:acyl transferase domain-containing protein
VVGQLFTSGYPVSIATANQKDISSLATKLVVDGPQYPFDTTQIYWHESRNSCDWRFRAGPTQSLLGLRTSDSNPLQPPWRKMLRVKEIPWVADHVVGNSIIFPAVGSIVVGIEAVKQTVSGSQAIRGYHLKEATFTSPIVVTPGQTTEVMTHLHPLQQAYERFFTGSMSKFSCLQTTTGELAIQ